MSPCMCVNAYILIRLALTRTNISSRAYSHKRILSLTRFTKGGKGRESLTRTDGQVSQPDLYLSVPV